MSTLLADTVLSHYSEHGTLPTTRYGRAYAHLTALRKAHDAGTLSEEIAQQLAPLGEWTQRKTAHNKSVGVDPRAINEHLRIVADYVSLNRTLPKSRTAAYNSLAYLRARSDSLPASVIEQLNILDGNWQAHYHGSDQQFLDTLEAVAQWRAKYPKRWPRAVNQSYNEGAYAAWLHRHRGGQTDVWRAEMLDARLPGWRDSGR